MSTTDPAEHIEPDEQPFQFRLRTLLIGASLVGLLLAGWRVHPRAAVLVLWAVLMIVAHVGGNAWGTRARQRTDRRASDAELAAMADSRPLRFAPSTRLRRSHRLGWPMVLATLIGIVVGAVAGTLALVALYRGEITGSPGLALGCVSGGVLGGLLGFLASTFVGVTARAFHEAGQDPARPRR